MPDGSAADVRELLRATFAARVEPAGWRMLVGEDEYLSLATFLYPTGSDFAATAEVSRATSFPDKPPVLVTDVSIGVAFEPLRRLWPLLGDFRVAVVTEHVWPPEKDEEAGDEGDRVPPFEVRSAADAERAADELAPLILERAPAFAQRYASLDVLLQESGGAARYRNIRHAALLAAADRLEEARASLELLRPPPDPQLSRRQRRTARQLRRWIDGGGNPALIPPSPPPSGFTHDKRRSLSELRAEQAKRHAAMEEVKQTARGKSRDEVRAIFLQEMARRGVEEQSPLWIENTLDHLWDSRAQQVHAGMRALKGLGKFAIGAAKAIKDREFPDMSVPDWLEPPDHALYEFPSTGPLVEVLLDADARSWLDRAYDALPKMAGSGLLTAWLGVESDVGLVIHLGERRVGRLDRDAAASYDQVVEDAALRDEAPCVRARLTRTPSGFLLEIGRPA